MPNEFWGVFASARARLSLGWVGGWAQSGQVVAESCGTSTERKEKERARGKGLGWDDIMLMLMNSKQHVEVIEVVSISYQSLSAP
jgi:hypothetical protein